MAKSKGFRYDPILLCDDAIQNLGFGGFTYGYCFKLQYPTYRGTFVSCIEGLRIEVDGTEIPAEQLRFSLNGKQFLIDELRELHREYWFVLDKATITVMSEGGLAEGEHEVCVSLRHRVPYTGYFGQYMVLDSKCSKKLPVAGGAK